jgi:hypothetical protein
MKMVIYDSQLTMHVTMILPKKSYILGIDPRTGTFKCDSIS